MSTLNDLVRTYKLSVSEQRWVLQNMRQEAERVGHTAALPSIDAALAVVDQARTAEKAYKAARGMQPDRGDAREFDKQIGMRLGVIHGMLVNLAQLGRNDARGHAASELLGVAFPGGLKARVQSSFLDKQDATDEFVATLRDPAHQATLRNTPIPALVDEVADLQARFSQQVNFASTVTYDDVQAARASGNDATTWAVCAIVSTAPVGDTALRETTLQPWVALKRRLGIQFRAERRAALGQPPAPEDNLPVEPTTPPADCDDPMPELPATPPAVTTPAPTSPML